MIEIEHENTTGSNSTTRWREGIGIIDGLLTPDECDELIAVHSSEPHKGYIDHLEVTRVSDLVAGGGEFEFEFESGSKPNNLESSESESTSTSSSLSWPLLLPVLRARYKMWEAVEGFFPDTRFEVFPEYTALTAWRPGSVLRMHYDSNKEYLEDRHYSALLYLNDPVSGDCDCECDCDNNNDNNDPHCRVGEDPGGEDSRHSNRNRNRSAHHPDNYHRGGFVGGDLVFEVPSKKENEKGDRAIAIPIAIPGTSTISIRPRAGRLVCFPSSSDYVHGVEEITHGTRYALTMWFTLHESAREGLESLQHEYFRQTTNATATTTTATTTAKANANAKIASRAPRFRQPWETPAQAVALRLRALQRAGLPKTRPRQARPRPRDIHNHNHNAHTEDESGNSFEVTDTELRHLIAHCWWKKGVPLGALLAVGHEQERQPKNNNMQTTQQGRLWTVEGGREFLGFFRDWKKGYLPRRSRGLDSALDRWMNHESGLIASVRDDEMEE